jgi:chemotaxis protein MotB
MGKKKAKCDCPNCLPAWLAAFGDLMSLLLCFFVLLLSMSTMDAKKVDEALGSLAGALSVLEGGVKTEVAPNRMQQATPLQSDDESSEAVNRVASAAVESNEMTKQTNGPAITIEEAEEGFVVNLPAKLLFNKGSSKVENEDTVMFLKRVAQIVKQMPNDVDVNIEGHTDNEQAPPPYKDNWELIGSMQNAYSIIIFANLFILYFALWGSKKERWSTK